MKILSIDNFIKESAGAPLRMRTPDRFDGDPLAKKKPGEMLDKQHEIKKVRVATACGRIREEMKAYIKNNANYKKMFDLTYSDMDSNVTGGNDDNVFLGVDCDNPENALFLCFTGIFTHKNFSSIPQNLDDEIDNMNDSQKAALEQYHLSIAPKGTVWPDLPYQSEETAIDLGIDYANDATDKDVPVALYRAFLKNFPYKTKRGEMAGKSSCERYLSDPSTTFRFTYSVSGTPVYGTIGIMPRYGYEPEHSYCAIFLEVKDGIVENEKEIVKSFKSFVDAVYGTLNGIFERVFK